MRGLVSLGDDQETTPKQRLNVMMAEHVGWYHSQEAPLYGYVSLRDAARPPAIVQVAAPAAPPV